MMNSGILVYHHLFSGSFSTNLQRNYPLFHQEFQKKSNRTFQTRCAAKTNPWVHISSFFVRLGWGCSVGSLDAKVDPRPVGGWRLLFPNASRFFCRIITSTNTFSKRENNTQKQTDTVWWWYMFLDVLHPRTKLSIANGAETAALLDPLRLIPWRQKESHRKPWFLWNVWEMYELNPQETSSNVSVWETSSTMVPSRCLEMFRSDRSGPPMKEPYFIGLMWIYDHILSHLMSV